MLMQLLALIKRGGLHRPSELAVELGVSDSLVEAMLGDLERMGYLDRVGGGCGPGACPGCSVACLRPGGQGDVVWQLTPAGARLVK